MGIINLRFVDKTPKPEYEAYVAVDVSVPALAELKAELEDSIQSYMETAFDYGTEDPFARAVVSVMDACGHRWVPIEVTTILI